MIPILSVEGLSAGYYGSNVLKDVSIKCEDEITLVIGPNGAGKSTLVKSITGTLRPVKGRITFEGAEIQNQKAYDIFKRGISTVPERGKVFREMTVKDNLRFALESSTEKNNSSFEEKVDFVMNLFPDLKDNLGKMAGKMSGGQQQMLSISRALVTEPRFLIMDEPTTGLYPKLLKELLLKIKTISMFSFSTPSLDAFSKAFLAAFMAISLGISSRALTCLLIRPCFSLTTSTGI